MDLEFENLETLLIASSGGYIPSRTVLIISHIISVALYLQRWLMAEKPKS